MSDPLLRAERLVKSYASGAGEIRVLRGLDLDIASGEALAVVGDSGVGKSTLLHVLGGLDRPGGGIVSFRGQEIYPGDSGMLARYRNDNVGFVFQFHHLLPEFSAVENVEMPFRIGRRPDGRATARDILIRMGLAERLDHRPGALSGGEQQRVAIARAVASGPDIVLADEPTGNLDPTTGVEVFNVLRDLQTELSFALVLATHSGRLARGCDRILRLEEGVLRAMEEAEAREYFDGVTG